MTRLLLACGLLCALVALCVLARADESTPVPVQAQSTEQLAQQSGCFECHSVEQHVLGPPYREVAARYRNNAAAREALIEKVKKGGKGNWSRITGGAPMPPHDGRLSDAEIARLVDWVLSR